MVQRLPICPVPPSSTTSLLSASSTRGYLYCNWWTYADVCSLIQATLGAVRPVVWTNVSCCCPSSRGSAPPPAPRPPSFYRLHSAAFARVSYCSNHTMSPFQPDFLLNMHVGFIYIFSWFHSSWGKSKTTQPFWNTVGWFLGKLNILLPRDPLVVTLRI